MKHFPTPPTLSEVAELLSGVQRWNGQTTIPWSVLQHSLLTAALLPDDASPTLRVVALLHDAAEAYVGDTPRPYKTKEQEVFEQYILMELYEGFGLDWVGFPSVHKAVRKADDLAALAEAEVLVYPGKRREVWSNTQPLTSHEEELVGKGEFLVWQSREMSKAEAIFSWLDAVESTIDDCIDDCIEGIITTADDGNFARGTDATD